MFYLETKDGDKYFTNKDSDDKLEFEKIIDAKLGRDAANMFSTLISDAEDKNENTFTDFAYRYKEYVNALDRELAEKEINRDRLDLILSDLQSLYNDIMQFII